MINDTDDILVKKLQDELSGMRNSASWRVTKPLRYAKNRVKDPGSVKYSETNTDENIKALKEKAAKRRAMITRYVIGAGNSMGAGKWASAVEQWEKILSSLSSDSLPDEIWPHYIKSLRMAGRLSVAKEVLSSRMSLPNRDFALLRECGEVMAHTDPGQAASMFSQAIGFATSKDQLALAYSRLIASYVRDKKLTEATRVVHKIPDNLKTYGVLVLAIAELHIESDKPEPAIKLLEKNLSGELPDSSVNFWLLLATAHIKAGQLALAKKVTTSGLIKFNDIRLELLYAEIFSHSEKWRDALREWSDLEVKYLHKDWVADKIKLQIRFNVSILGRIVDIKTYQKQIRDYKNSNENRTIAIVTSYTKGYDTLLPPAVINNNYDYIVYTDDEKANSYGIYDIRPLPKPDIPGPLAIRYVKTHPHVLAKDYDIAVWVDTNVMICQNLEDFLSKFKKSGLAIGSGVHPLRYSIYDEYLACLDLGKGDPAQMKRQIDAYRSENFEGKGLAENTVLLFRPNDKKTKLAMDEWWKQITTYSTRDQLSFPYALMVHNIQWHKHTAPPLNIRNNPLFILTQHHTNYGLVDVLSKKLAE